MTRGNPGDLQPFDIEIDRTFHILAKHFRNLSLESLHLDSVSLNNSEHSSSVSANLNVLHTADSDFIHTENNMSQPSPPRPRERTLWELVAPEFTYESLCIQYSDEDVPYVLKTGLIHLLPKFNGLASEFCINISRNSI